MAHQDLDRLHTWGGARGTALAAGEEWVVSVSTLRWNFTARFVISLWPLGLQHTDQLFECLLCAGQASSHLILTSLTGMTVQLAK